jgi:hypothetical protein
VNSRLSPEQLRALPQEELEALVACETLLRRLPWLGYLGGISKALGSQAEAPTVVILLEPPCWLRLPRLNFTVTVNSADHSVKRSVRIRVLAFERLLTGAPG